MEKTAHQLYAEALVAAIGELQNVPKTAANPYFKSKYAPLDAIIEATRPVLAKHGLAVMQSPWFEEGKAGVQTRIIHKGGHSESSSLLLPLKDQSPQGVGSAITYARRYALAAVLGIASEDDDDGNVSTGLHKKEKAQDSRPYIEKAADKQDKVPRPAPSATTTWRDMEVTDLKIASKSGPESKRKWTLYAVTFNGTTEAMTFDETLYNKAKDLALEKVDAGVAPNRKDPSKWELVSIQPTSGQVDNITTDDKE